MNIVQETQFVYSWFQSDDDRFDRWIAHRVLKRTREFVYVARKLGRTEYTIKLRRAELEEYGSVWWRSGSRTGGERFYTEQKKVELEHARELRIQNQVPGCFMALGLTRDATAKDVTNAYHKLALKEHPDQGGNHDAFLMLQENYAEALKIVESR